MTKKVKRNSGGFFNGDGYSVQLGNINENWQMCLGTRRKEGTHTNAVIYAMFCLNCGHLYGANSGDVHERLCQKCSPDNSTGEDLVF